MVLHVLLIPEELAVQRVAYRVPSTPRALTTRAEAEWRAQLAGQTRITISATGALTTVRAAWARAIAATALQGRSRKR